jgi:hypothetical protein
LFLPLQGIICLAETKAGSNPPIEVYPFSLFQPMYSARGKGVVGANLPQPPQAREMCMNHHPFSRSWVPGRTAANFVREKTRAPVAKLTRMKIKYYRASGVMGQIQTEFGEMPQRIDALFVRGVKYWLASLEGLSALLCASASTR